MEPVERIWCQVQRVGVIMFLLFLTLSLSSLLLSLFLTKNDFNVGSLLFKILFFQGIMWLTGGAIGFVYNRVLEQRLAQFKAKGDFYEVSIKRIIPSMLVNLGGFVAAALEGHYTDNSGNSHMVRSTHHKLSTFDRKEYFAANVYVDKNDPKSYLVEVLRKE